MFGALRNLVLYRLLGARVMLGLAALGFVRRMFFGKRDDRTRRQGSGSRESSGGDVRPSARR